MADWLKLDELLRDPDVEGKRFLAEDEVAALRQQWRAELLSEKAERAAAREVARPVEPGGYPRDLAKAAIEAALNATRKEQGE